MGGGWGGAKVGHTYCVVEGRGVCDGELGAEGVDSAGTICLLVRFCVDYHKIFPATEKNCLQKCNLLANLPPIDLYETQKKNLVKC